VASPLLIPQLDQDIHASPIGNRFTEGEQRTDGGTRPYVTLIASYQRREWEAVAAGVGQHKKRDHQRANRVGHRGGSDDPGEMGLTA
jgi:hypothetical protein